MELITKIKNYNNLKQSIKNMQEDYLEYQNEILKDIENLVEKKQLYKLHPHYTEPGHFVNVKYSYYNEDDSEDSDTTCETIVNCEKCSKEIIFDYHLESIHTESSYILLLKFETINIVCDLLGYPRIDFKVSNC